MQPRTAAVVLAFGSLSLVMAAQQKDNVPDDTSAITVYKDFAVVRAMVDLDLKPGTNEVTTTNVTRQLEPDSVVLRDAKGGAAINVVEQNYDAAVVDQTTLLKTYEGQSIDFQSLIYGSDQVGQHLILIPGKVIRAPVNGVSPIIEVNGKLQFNLPGMPIFPTGADSLQLKPTLRWQIAAIKAESLRAELDYITRGMSWQSTYNIVSPARDSESGVGVAEIVGWVTIHNDSGTEFPKANIKLMAGDVAKIQPEARAFNNAIMSQTATVNVNAGVTQKAFDDFHLYDLHRTVDLRDGEIKQVEFLHAAQVPITRKYEYDGAGSWFAGYSGLNTEREFGAQSLKKVTIVQEFKNSEANHLGVPLPAGRIRFYRQDTGGQVEFTGESTIDHTPKDGTIRVITGFAFDITGDRKQTDFHVDSEARTIDESFEIKVKNAKEQPVTVSVIERLYRWSNWTISAKSGEFKKTDSRTVEFPVQLAANEEKTLTYTVHYSW